MNAWPTIPMPRRATSGNRNAPDRDSECGRGPRHKHVAYPAIALGDDGSLKRRLEEILDVYPPILLGALHGCFHHREAEDVVSDSTHRLRAGSQSFHEFSQGACNLGLSIGEPRRRCEIGIGAWFVVAVPQHRAVLARYTPRAIPRGFESRTAPAAVVREPRA